MREAVSFDWVSARFECGVAAPFLSLRDAGQRDTETHNRLSGTERFTFARNNDTGFSISRCGPHEGCVVFTRRQQPPRIEITGYGIPDELEVRTGLNAAGECELVLGNDRSPVPEWRILSKALDALFFDDRGSVSV